MKKRILYIYIILILTFVACSNREHTSEPSFQPPIENIQWGMMPETVMDIMKLSEKNILYQDESGASIRCEDMEVFGQKADVEMSFDIRYQLGLLGMRIIFEEPVQDGMVDVLNNVYGEYCEVNDAGSPCKWGSETVEELPEEIQERYRYAQIEVPAQRNLSGDFSQEAQWDVLKKQALVAVTLRNDILNYDAGNMAAYRNLYSDEAAYEEFLHRIE